MKIGKTLILVSHLGFSALAHGVKQGDKPCGKICPNVENLEENARVGKTWKRRTVEKKKMWICVWITTFVESSHGENGDKSENFFKKAIGKSRGKCRGNEETVENAGEVRKGKCKAGLRFSAFSTHLSTSCGKHLGNFPIVWIRMRLE